MSDAVNAPGGTDGNDEDYRLLAELTELGARVDPVPAEALAAARSAIAWRAMDRELAELIEDPSDARLADVRTRDTPTTFSFESPHLAIEIEVRRIPSGRSLLGQLVPAQAAAVEVRHRGGTISVTADEAGRFAAGPMAAGPVSVRCVTGPRILETDWFLA